MARKNTRNTYTRRGQGAAPTSLAGVWLLLGIFLGVGIMVLAYIFYNPTHSQHFKIGQSGVSGSGRNGSEFSSESSAASGSSTSSSASRATAAPKMPQERTKTQARKTHDVRNDPDQRFEFYTLLPGMEVELPETQNSHASDQASAQSAAQASAQTIHSVHPTNSMQSTNKISAPKIPTPSQSETRVSAVEKPKSKTQVIPIQQKAVVTTMANPVTENIIPTPSTVNSQTSKKESSSTVPTASATAAIKTVTKKSPADPSANIPNNISNNKSKSSHYIIQAGIFQGLTAADALKARLTLQGFAPQIQKVQTQDGHAWFRVTLGPFASESLALNQKKRLEDQKVRGILILQRPSE